MILGLSGGIGSGKTACSRWFEARGVPIIDADVIARELLAPQSALLPHIQSALGADLVANGVLNRALLRERIFQNEAARLKLNAITHPAIRVEILSQLERYQRQSAWVILSAPLLLENGLDKLCHWVMVVDVPESVQIQRTMQRDGCDEAHVRAIMSKQISRSKRLAAANFVVDNSQCWEDTERQLICFEAFMRQSLLGLSH